MVDNTESNVDNTESSVSGVSEEKPVDNGGKTGPSVSRRGVISSLGAAGLLIGTSGSAAAASGDHLGESWSGSPGNNLGLKIDLQESGQALKGIAGTGTDTGSDIGVKGVTYSNSGIGLEGVAPVSSGSPIGLKGRVDTPDGTGLKGQVFTTDPGVGNAIYGESYSDDGTAIKGRARGSGTTYGVVGEVDSSNGIGLYTPDKAKIDGDLEVAGTKNFVQTVDTASGPKEVAYTAVEAGEPRTEATDVAEMEDGVAVVDLPDHFGMVTSSEEDLTVQVTAYCDEQVHPQVTDRSTERIIVKDFGDGPDDYAFAYTVKGIRAGFENQEIVRDT